MARYKGFLHLIRRNKERSIKSFTVPTYDIDLIWHTHQLHPASYCKDLVDIMGKVLEHDDTDSDRTKGKKLDTGFFRTTRQWEETYGLRYWRAGAMYRGSSPSPLGNSYYPSNPVSKSADIFHEHQKIMQYPEMEAVEVIFSIFLLLALSSQYCFHILRFNITDISRILAYNEFHFKLISEGNKCKDVRSGECAEKPK